MTSTKFAGNWKSSCQYLGLNVAFQVVRQKLTIPVRELIRPVHLSKRQVMNIVSVFILFRQSIEYK